MANRTSLGQLNNDAAAEKVEIKLLDKGITLYGYDDYSFEQDITEPLAKFKFSYSSENITETILNIQNGERIGFFLNDKLQSTSFADQFNYVENARNGGQSIEIICRDTLSAAAETDISPEFSFKETETLSEVILKVLKPFKFSKLVIADNIQKTKLTKVNRQFAVDDYYQLIEKQLTSPINTKFKPKPGEGCLEFVRRLCRRFGATIWAGPDGETIYVGGPTFTDPVQYEFHSSKADPRFNNIEDVHCTYEWFRQPNAILAEGHGGNSKGVHSQFQVLMLNELTTDQTALASQIADLKKSYKSLVVMPFRTNVKRPSTMKVISEFIKIEYIKDSQSHSIKQLENYTRSIMAERQSGYMKLTLTVPKHSQSGVSFIHNTMCHVIIEGMNFDQPMWIKSRTLMGSKNGGGTRTRLELCLPYTYQLGES